MADGRKLSVRASGAGDPTYLLEFKLENEEVNTVYAAVNVNLKANPNGTNGGAKGMAWQMNFPANENILMGKAFAKNDWNDTPEASEYVSTTLQFTFYASDKTTVEETVEIDYPTTPILATKDVNLGDSQTAALHFTGDEDGDLVFFTVSDNSTLALNPSFNSAASQYMWTIVNFKDSTHGQLYSIYNAGTNRYLYADGDNVVLSYTAPSNDNLASLWSFTSETSKDGKTKVFRIQNGASAMYLAGNTTDGTVELSTSTGNTWYLHVLPTD